MKSSAFSQFALLALTLAAAPLVGRAVPETEAKAGREIVKRFADSIVGVEMVVTIKMNMGDRAMPPRENKVDINGTIVTSSGLTVTSLAAIDPRTQFAAMAAMMGPNGQRVEISETDYKEVKLRLADGSEVPAKVVLKDADLDLAFIAPVVDPSGAKREFTPVKLEDAGEGVLLNTYILVARAPKALQRVPLVRPTFVTGIVEKPRRLYLLSDQQMGPAGTHPGHQRAEPERRPQQWPGRPAGRRRRGDRETGGRGETRRGSQAGARGSTHRPGRGARPDNATGASVGARAREKALSCGLATAGADK